MQYRGTEVICPASTTTSDNEPWFLMPYNMSNQHYSKSALLIIVAVALSGCLFDFSDDDSQYPPLENTQWSMERLVAADSIYTDTDADHFTAAFTDSTVSGRGDCNIWSSTFSYDDDGEFSLNGLSTTEVACQPGSFESVFYGVLVRSTSYSADDDNLSLHAPNGDRIDFEEE